MPNAIVSWINNIFGSNITHVANAYPRDIWVLFHSRQCSIDFKISLQKLTPTVDISTTDNGAITENIRVKTRSVYRKERDQRNEYLSIYTYEENGQKRLICENKQILANKSFIITQDGYIIDQNYGDNVWVDRHGNRH